MSANPGPNAKQPLQNSKPIWRLSADQIWHVLGIKPNYENLATMVDLDGSVCAFGFGEDELNGANHPPPLLPDSLPNRRFLSPAPKKP
jgi:hypothetical protein